MYPVLAIIDLPTTVGGLVVALLFAWWGANIATAKGYAPGFGAVMGFLCNCVGIAILYLFVPHRR